MTNRITEELINGAIAESNIDTISTCKFVKYCIKEEYEENIAFLISRGCDVDLLRDLIDDHIEVEDAQLQIFAEIKSTLTQRSSEPVMTPGLNEVFQQSKIAASANKRPVFFEDIINAAFHLEKSEPDMYIVYFFKKSGYKHDPEGNKTSVKGKYKFITEHCDDLNERAKNRLIDPIIGRRKEVERIVEILAHHKKKNPMLVGLPGVGKTAVVEGLASLIEQGQVPNALKKVKIYSLNVGNILAGSKFRGEFEEKVKGILDDFERMKKKNDIHPVLFVDEVHQVMGAGAGGSKEGVDLANMIKPGLANGSLSCIGATTDDEFNQKITKDKALMRRFQVVKIDEPSAKETLRILEQGIKPVLEKYHGVTYSKAVLERIVELSGQYITTQYFPDKAISVCDSVGARLKTTKKGLKVAKVIHVEEIISTITGTPIEAFKQTTGKDKYVDIAANIKETLFGQEDAVDKVVEQLELARAGFRVEGQPVGSFLLLGPTGTGKTELAKQIAAQTKSNFFKLNMSEFSEKHSVAKLFGAPPGYEGHDAGGVLTNEVMNFPHTVLLLDEIEKADKKVYDALLGIIDGASMTDGRDNKVDFSNVLVLMTSNAGAAVASTVKKPLGLMVTNDHKIKSSNKAQEAVVTQTFSPEFRNKLNDIVYFNSLSEDIMIKIVDKFLRVVKAQLAVKGINLSVSKKAKQTIAKDGYDPKMGARPIKREIDLKITKRLVKPILKAEVVAGDTIKITVKNGDYIIDFVKSKEKKVKEIVSESK